MIHNYMQKLQKSIEKKLYDFIDVLDEAICNRCFIKRSIKRSGQMRDPHPQHHNQGKLYVELSLNTNVTEKKVDQWIFDQEHGLLHGFLVAFFAYLNVLKTTSHNDILDIINHGSFENCWFEKLMVSCFLHDFARCDGHQDHDKNLEKYYPKLSPETYSHTHPKKDTPLVIGDRIELMRFSNWKSWVDANITNIKAYTHDIEPEIKHFYYKMRPALQILFNNRYSIWVSHGSEVKIDFNKKTYPQGVSGVWKQQNLNLYSVEIGKLFTFTTNSFNNSNCMFDHANKWPPQGLIPLSSLKKRGYKLITCRSYKNKKLLGKDHFGIMDLSIPIDEWVFFYDYKLVGKFASVDDMTQHTLGLENKLIMRILHTTEKFMERLKILAC